MGTLEMSHLLGQLRPRIYRQVLSSIGDADDAEDVCQEVLLAVFRFLPSFRGDGKLTSWVYRITYNTIASYLRREAIDRSPRGTSGEEDHVFLGGTHFDRSLDLETLWFTVCRFSRELPLAQREAVSWSLQGYRPTEIARATGVCPGTARSNLHRGRVKLRDRLQREYPRFVAELLE